MAQKTITIRTDDIDGTTSDDHTTVGFAIDGKAYEIDLSPDNASKLREFMSVYAKSGRRIKTAPAAAKANGSDAAPAQEGPTTAQVRTWALDQGIDLPPRGRIAKDIFAKYVETHAK
jgi:Lsr2